MDFVGPVSRRHRTGLLCGSSVAIGLTLGLSSPAFAQQISSPASAVQTSPSPSAPTAPNEQASTAAAPDAAPRGPLASPSQEAPSSETSAKDKDIVVTGTRVIRDGYQAPTPTSVVGAAEIASKAPANIADFVNELPSLASSATPRTTVYQLSSGNYGVNALNLRNLGANRTLVLLDGQRVGNSTLGGLVDINNFPQALIKRVDVVTGGASADWGSDAVAGVVNFVLDTNYTGVKGTAQTGITTYGDDASYNVSLTAGTKFAGDRGHIIFSAERNYNDGIRGVPRDWFHGKGVLINPNYTATNGQPQLIVGDNIGLSNATPGGIITTGPLAGTYFGPNGVPTRFNYGSLVTAPFMQGGDWRYSTIATGGDLDGRLTRNNFFGRASFDITNDIQIFVQGSYSTSYSTQHFGYQYQLGNLTIQPDNAFIPASIASQITAPFNLGTFNQDLGPITITNKRTAIRGVVGLKGKFNALGSSWSWDTYYQKSVNNIYNSSYLTITPNYRNAIDSVRNANGVIVCRVTLTNPNSGCVPYDIFGTGVNSQAAINYVKGTAYGKPKLTEDVAAATLRGNPFSTWAGPVSIATGVEYRREEVSGTNDPLSTTRSYFAGNYQNSFGSYHVAEGFFEAVAPLYKGLDLNGAVRVTDYSTSGTVVTWKGGVTFTPVEDITFRFTRSRDIRAPNLQELFVAGATNTSTAPDPFRGNVSSTFFTLTQGNLALKPEKADTLGVGVVLKPRFIRGFEASVDYYNIDINGAIFTVDAQTLINQCFAGNTALCGQIARNSAGVISQITVQPINLAKQTNRGVDMEASYRTGLEPLLPSIGGNLTLRVLATRFIKNYTNNGINVPTDTVGTNNANQGAFLSLPKWRYLASAAWNNDSLALTFTARGFSAGVNNTSYIECTANCPASTAANMTINNNHLPGATYFDVNATYTFRKGWQAFVSVDNLINKDPAQVPYGTSVGGANLPVNPALYDTLGRLFRVGVRFAL